MMTSGLQFGERLPDFRRYDTEENICHLFNDLHSGQPVLLLAVGEPDALDTEKVLAWMDLDNPYWKGFLKIILLPCEPTQAAAWRKRNNLKVKVLADDGSLIQFVRGKAADKSPASVLLFDRNLRLVKRWDEYETNPEFVAHATQALAAELEREPVVVQHGAPALFIPRVFEPDFCDDMIEMFEKDGGKPSGVYILEGDKRTWTPDPEVKVRRDYYFKQDDPWLDQVRERVVRRVLPEIRHAFNYPVNSHDPFRMICYDAEEQGYFRPHRDNVTPDAAHRRFAMTINMNTGDYQGGALRFPEYGPELYLPEKGSAVIFCCSLVHEATPVTSGKRYAMLSFFYNDRDRQPPG